MVLKAMPERVSFRAPGIAFKTTYLVFNLQLLVERDDLVLLNGDLNDFLHP